MCCTWLALRHEVLQMLELKQQVAKQAGRNTPGSSADGRKRAPKSKVGRFPARPSKGICTLGYEERIPNGRWGAKSDEVWSWRLEP